MDNIKKIKNLRRYFLQSSLIGLAGVGIFRTFGFFGNDETQDYYTHTAVITIAPDLIGASASSVEEFYQIFPPNFMANFNSSLNHARSENLIVSRKISVLATNKLIVFTIWKNKIYFDKLYKNKKVLDELSKLDLMGISIKLS